MWNRDKREFIQVLRLLEAMPLTTVTEAVRLGAPGLDAVKLIALARIERRPPRIGLAAYPHVPQDGREDDARARLCSAGGMTGKDAMPGDTTAGMPQVLLAHHLQQLKLPTVLRKYEKVARECAQDGIDHLR